MRILGIRPSTIPLLAGVLLLAAAPAVAAQSLVDPAVPQVEPVFGIGIWDYAPACAESPYGCSPYVQRNTRYGSMLGLTINVRKQAGFTVEASASGHTNWNDTVRYLLVGPRFGLTPPTSFPKGRGQFYGQLLAGPGWSDPIPGRTTPSGLVLLAAGGAESWTPCSFTDPGAHCLVGVEVGYRFGLGEASPLSGWRALIRIGLAFGGDER